MECQASVALIIDGDKFLLIKRAERNNDPWSGQMALPGGHRNAGESCIDTAKRETLEEVGIKINIENFIGVFTTLYGKLSVAAFTASCKNNDVTIDEEINAYFWAPFGELVRDNSSYTYKKYLIFGLTYRIISSYLATITK